MTQDHWEHGSHETSNRWKAVFSQIPTHHDAPSTRYYRECEEHLFHTYVGNLHGKRVLKTDLWDEARNTRILLWASQQGAHAYGIDIALSVVQEAQQVFRRDGTTPGFVAADIRQIPFSESAFDVVYSMGTVEHFPETEQAVREIYRVLRPGGTAIIGVPNKLDPFLRPLLVTALNWFGGYPYGYEKSYTQGQLASLARRAGFQVREVTGVLFIPGILRMVDLFLYTRWPRVTFLTGLLVRPFSFFYKRSKAVRRHGYLIACIARRPESSF
jgi:SAM-dependent methyltransferase